MKSYAHRGNTFGRNSESENTIDYINRALKAGYGAEIDVTRGIDNKYYLGHDKPEQIIDREFMEDDRIIVHAKTVDTFTDLLKYKQIHSFYQSQDSIVITSWGKKLYHETLKFKRDFEDDEIVVDLDFSELFKKTPYGVISDNVGMFSPSVYNEKIEKTFKLLILDVDGVMTNGRKTYDVCHEVKTKEFCDRDFTAIKRFKSAGIPVIILSGDRFNIGMAHARDLVFYNVKDYSKQLDKTIPAKIIASINKLKMSEIAYVGDDYYDLSLLNSVGFSYCPLDAADIVKKNVQTIINRKGGEGVVEGLFELVKDKITQRFPYES